MPTWLVAPTSPLAALFTTLRETACRVRTASHPYPMSAGTDAHVVVPFAGGPSGPGWRHLRSPCSGRRFRVPASCGHSGRLHGRVRRLGQGTPNFCRNRSRLRLLLDAPNNPYCPQCFRFPFHSASTRRGRLPLVLSCWLSTVGATPSRAPLATQTWLWWAFWIACRVFNLAGSLRTSVPQPCALVTCCHECRPDVAQRSVVRPRGPGTQKSTAYYSQGATPRHVIQAYAHTVDWGRGNYLPTGPTRTALW